MDWIAVSIIFLISLWFFWKIIVSLVPKSEIIFHHNHQYPASSPVIDDSKLG